MMKLTNRVMQSASVAVCVCFQYSPVAYGALEEVIVTAQKRSESIQDVPISMRAISGDDIRKMEFTNSDEVLASFPNLTVSKQSANNTNIFIRGVGTNDFHLNSVSAVGVYLDEVSINSPYGTGFSLYDLERVEVMRGPQNTLFGRNTTGGAVNFISRKPDPAEDFNGYLNASFGNNEQSNLEGAVGVPLSDKTALRISGITQSGDNIWENPLSDDEWGEIERHSARAQVRFLPTDTADVLWNLHAGVNRGNGRPFKTFGLRDPADPQQPCQDLPSRVEVNPVPNCALGDGFIPPKDGDWNEVFSGEKSREDIDVWGSSLSAKWEFEELTFSSITSFTRTEIKRNDDSDASPGIVLQFYQEADLDQWGQDLRLAFDGDTFRWIGGVYYFNEESDYATVARRTPTIFSPSAPGSFTIVPATSVDQENEVYSAYGQAEQDISTRLTVTLGLRWSNETKEGENITSVGNGLLLPDEDFFIGFDGIAQSVAPHDPVSQPNGGICPPPVGGLPCINPAEKLEGDWREWGGRLSLDYQVHDDLMVYGSISRGFKGGSFSVAALSGLTGLAAQPVDPEVLLAYEIGGKAALLGNKLQLNGALFYYDWDDLQSFQVKDGVPQLLNVPEASVVGAEAEIEYAPTDDWFVSMGLGYLSGEIEDAEGIATVEKGNDLVQTPEWTANLLVRKEFQLKKGLLSLETDFVYQDEKATDLSNTSYLYVDSHHEINARASYVFGGREQYRVSLWGKNITEEQYAINTIDGAGTTGGITVITNDGIASYGLSLSIDFE